MDLLRGLTPAEFWSGIILFCTIGGITTACAIAIGKGREVMLGILLVIVVVLALSVGRG